MVYCDVLSSLKLHVGSFDDNSIRKKQVNVTQMMNEDFCQGLVLLLLIIEPSVDWKIKIKHM